MANRKSYMGFRLTPRSMTLDDIEFYKFEFSENFSGFRIFRTQQQLHLEGFLRRGCRQNLYSTDKPTKPSISQIVEEADENLFNSIGYNPSHLLHQLLPRRTESSYSLRSRPPQLWTLSYPRWQKFYWPYAFYPRDAMLARVIVIATCPSVCPSVCPSRAGIVSKRRKLAACFFTIW